MTRLKMIAKKVCRAHGIETVFYKGGVKVIENGKYLFTAWPDHADNEFRLYRDDALLDARVLADNIAEMSSGVEFDITF